MDNATKTLAQMAVEELRAYAVKVECRYLAQAANLLASAKENVALGNKSLAAQYLERAKVAHKRAQEVEEDRVKRTMRDMAERESGTMEVVSNLSTHINVHEQYKNDNIRGHGWRR